LLTRQNANGVVGNLLPPRAIEVQPMRRPFPGPVGLKEVRAYLVFDERFLGIVQPDRLRVALFCSVELGTKFPNALPAPANRVNCRFVAR
jgi:hypothetical protein